MAMSNHILLLIPTPFEAATLPRPTPFTTPHATVHTRIAGIGPEAIRRAFRNAMGSGSYDALLLAGFAGALAPRFAVAGCHECSPADETTDDCHRRLRQWPIATIRSSPVAKADRQPAKIVSATTVVATAAAKQLLHSATGADLVDMEGEPFIELARAHGIPWRIIRCVSDGACQDLPTAALGAGFDVQTLSNTPLRLLRHLATRPADILPFLAFIRNLSPARRNLTTAILHACGAGDSSSVA